MTATIQAKAKMTAQEYLKLEREGLRERSGKHEFYNQNRIYRTGGTHPHNKTLFNAGLVLGIQSMQKKLKLDITTSETKVPSFLDYKNYFYPDVVVVDGAPYFEDEHKDILVNPTLIIEVLSEGTEAFDRGEKFKSYRQIHSLKEYILINSMKKSIEQFYRNDSGIWQIGDEVKVGVLTLHSLPNVELQIDDIYSDVVFDNASLTPPQ